MSIKKITARIHLRARADMACETWGGHGDGHTTTDSIAMVDCPSCLDEVRELGAAVTR